MTTAEEWSVLMARVKDMAVDSYVIATHLALMDKKANGRHVFVGEQVEKAIKLCDDLQAFVKARVEEARQPKQAPSAPTGTPAHPPRRT